MLGYADGFLAVAGAGSDRGMLFLDAMFFLVALVLPLLLIWLAAWLAEELDAPARDDRGARRVRRRR